MCAVAIPRRDDKDNFAHAFDVQFLAASGQREYVWQTSWGVSTRMVRGLIICHGDDAGVRVVLDEQIDVNFGRRAIDAELKGIPVRVELGPRDIAAGRAMLVRRIPGTKEPVALTVRCLTRPDCSLPASGDEPDLIAWVGRSY